ncbi:MAG TPA: MmgE/PrpD family protein [Candidatus Binatia bacterium]|nr:MmgE/PrpD family protein [Candidatus Binatia bacterium]
MTASERLADELLAIRDGALPAAVLDRAQDFLLDFLGVALGGVPEESTLTLRRGLGALGLRGDAVVLGTSDRLPAPQAALANGAAAHTLEMDDTHSGGSIHLGASVLPAVLAAATLRPTSGEALLRAAVGGYEVAARLAMALKPGAHYARGFHPTGTCGAFGSAAAAGMILGLDAPALVNALGIAGSQASGSMEFLEDGAWTKRFHPGWSASAGLHAAALAGAGFRAPATILEGRFGTLMAYSGDADARALDPGDDFELLRTSIKPHACCRYMQAPIDASLALCAEHGIGASDVERVDVGIVAAGFPIVCEPTEQKRRPASVVDAQFSLPFGIAVAIARRSASPDDFLPAVFDDPTVVDLMARVTAVRDAALDAQYPRVWPAWVRITGRDGRRHEAAVSHPKGDPENFPTTAELLGKFRRLAGRALPAAQVERLGALVQDVRRSRDVTQLLDATVPTGT